MCLWYIYLYGWVYVRCNVYGVLVDIFSIDWMVCVNCVDDGEKVFF